MNSPTPKWDPIGFDPQPPIPVAWKYVGSLWRAKLPPKMVDTFTKATALASAACFLVSKETKKKGRPRGDSFYLGGHSTSSHRSKLTLNMPSLEHGATCSPKLWNWWNGSYLGFVPLAFTRYPPQLPTAMGTGLDLSIARAAL